MDETTDIEREFLAEAISEWHDKQGGGLGGAL
jgi:hypothetical protein